MKTRQTSRKAFTLIELLVVVLILGILVAVAIPSYMSSVNTSKLNTANSNAKTIATALQAYGVKNGSYPTSANAFTTSGILADLGGSIPTNPCGSASTPGVASDWALGAGGTTTDTITPANTSCTGALQTVTVSL